MRSVRSLGIATAFAGACSLVINVLDPDVIVVGGGILNIPRLAESGTAARGICVLEYGGDASCPQRVR
jgi:predicted NBD/HSP70 family sugar kinase